MPSTESRAATAVCVDFGSTWTKALHVDLATGGVLGAASHPTTLREVMEGYAACLAALVEQDRRAATARTLACSSAGGGLRIAVVGNEELVTAEAGRRVALSSGGRVVAVVPMAGSCAAPGDLEVTLGSTRPDVVLLAGGTDGGNSEVLLRSARALAECAAGGGWRGPVVIAGNVAAQDRVSAILADLPHVLADNVVPQIGVLAPESARARVREMFLDHVIGGKGLSRRPEFAAMVRGATPDVVLTGVEVLAELAGDVVVVDVGGATTDVHSVVRPDPEAQDVRGEVVAVTPLTRTVEGDLGMRWSAPSTVAAGGLPDLAAAARQRHDDPGWLPSTDEEWEAEEAIAAAAVGLALRRHAGRSRVVVSTEGKAVERSGTDLRRVALVIGSGGVLRHGRPGVAARVLGWDAAGGWMLPEAAEIAIDRDYVLAAAGLLARTHPDAARRLVGPLAGAAAGYRRGRERRA